MQRVGKKASLDRLSFAADGCMYDDGYGHGWRKHEQYDDDYEEHMNMLHTYEYRDNDGGCDSDSMYYVYDEQQELAVDPNVASAKYLAARSKQKQKKTKKSGARPPMRSSGSSSSSSSLNIIRPAARLRYYNRDPRTRLLSSGLEDNLLLHVATFLDLRSVAGWSCTGRLANELLSADTLYCTSSSSSSSESSTCLLPCVRKLSYQLSLSGGGGISRPRGLARTMAHEADRIFGHGGVRNVAVAGHVRCKEEVDSVRLLDQQGAIAIVTKTCEVEVHWVGDNGANGSNGSTKKGRGKATTKSSLKLPRCDLLLGSTFHAQTRTVALLSTVTAGRRYMLSLVWLPSFRGDAPEIILQCKLPPCNLSSTSDAREVLQFNANGSKLLLGTTEKFFVADARFETNRMWTPGQGSTISRGNCASVTLHDRFVFALRGRQISIYDTSSASDERPIATGRLDSTTEKPERALIFGGRIWFICASYLFCSPKGILQNLNKLSLDGGRECGDTRRGGYVFLIDKDHTFPLAPSKHRCAFKHGNDLLFVSSGREIRVFDRRRREMTSSPFVFSAESPVTSMFADNTKLVCATKHPNRRSGRIEIFHLDVVANTVLAKLLVKKTFQSQHMMHSPQLSGRFASVGYSYDDGDKRAAALGSGGRFASSPRQSPTYRSRSIVVRGEVQVFDLLRLEGK